MDRGQRPKATPQGAKPLSSSTAWPSCPMPLQTGRQGTHGETQVWPQLSTSGGLTSLPKASVTQVTPIHTGGGSHQCTRYRRAKSEFPLLSLRKLSHAAGSLCTGTRCPVRSKILRHWPLSSLSCSYYERHIGHLPGVSELRARLQGSTLPCWNYT